MSDFGIYCLLHSIEITYTLGKLTVTDTAVPAVRGWFTECGYSWPAEISSKATLDRRGRSGEEILCLPSQKAYYYA